MGYSYSILVSAVLVFTTLVVSAWFELEPLQLTFLATALCPRCLGLVTSFNAFSSLDNECVWKNQGESFSL